MQNYPPGPPSEPESQPSSIVVGLTTKVMKGSIWTLTGHVAPLLFSFFATPFVIRLLGAEAYGVFILIGLIPTYFNFADFGMGLASTKFGSEAYASSDADREARIVRTAGFIALGTSLPIALAMMVFSGWIISFFSVPDEFQGEAILALKIAAATFVLNFLNTIFNSPQLVRLRMDLNTLAIAVPRIVGVIATPLVIYAGGGIVGAVFVLFSASLLTFIVNLYFSRRLLSELIGLSIEREMVGPLIKFGGALVIATIAGVFLINFEKLVLARVTSVETLAHYAIAFTLANMVTIFTTAMAQSLVPAFSQLGSPEKFKQLEVLYARSLRVNIFALLPSLVILAIIAKPFFTVWAGPEFGVESPLPFYILLAGLFFNLNAYIPWSVMLAQGRTDVLAKLYWIELFPYIGLTALLTYYLGAAGAAAAWSIRVISESYVFFRYARRLSGVNFPLGNYLRTLILGSSILLLPLLWAVFVDNLSPWLLLGIPASLTLYSILVWKFIIEPEEKTWVAQRTNNLYNRIFHFV